ncbi:MAG: glycosyltransferase family A protein, partial [Gemmataceae bacterium]
MGNPQVSLVICTRNRVARLKRCLQYVAKQRPSCTWELVVVDNGSSDETRAVLTEYVAGVPFSARVVQEPAPGVGRAKNAGWAASRGEIIAFTDDDCYIAPDYIDRVWKAFCNNTEVGFAGGRVDLFDPMDFPLTINTSAELAFLKPRTNFTIGPIVGANM